MTTLLIECIYHFTSRAVDTARASHHLLLGKLGACEAFAAHFSLDGTLTPPPPLPLQLCTHVSIVLPRLRRNVGTTSSKRAQARRAKAEQRKKGKGEAEGTQAKHLVESRSDAGEDHDGAGAGTSAAIVEDDTHEEAHERLEQRAQPAAQLGSENTIERKRDGEAVVEPAAQSGLKKEPLHEEYP